MNYLAHSFLSPADSQILLGNIACDMIRPRDIDSLPHKVKEGMALHQEIDRYTDRHIGFKTLRDLLNSRNLPYAGVLADIIFDHCLARDWDMYSNQSLSNYSRMVYKVLLKSNYNKTIPGHFSYLSAALVRDDWFSSYASFQGLTKALKRLQYRCSREILIPVIMNTVINNSCVIDKAFHALMQDQLSIFPHHK